MRAVLIGCAMLIGAAAPAGAAMNVFGSTIARECYEAAMSGGGNGASLCQRALSNDEMTARDKAATYVNRGIIYNTSRQLDLSLADFNAALAIDPKLGEAYLNRGNTHFFRRQFDEALADYSKAIELKISNIDYAYYNRALVYEALSRLPEAKANLAAALAITPEFKAASDRLAIVDQAVAEGPAAPPAAETTNAPTADETPPQ
jgi:tetratricopeptide (TPR) repeat protein